MKRTPFTLFCLPCAGASALMYLRWRRLLPPWVQVEPVELPGRGARIEEAAEESFDSLVARVSGGLAAKLTEPYALFGHSMGALLSYGIAHELRVRGAVMPTALLVSACAAPSRQEAESFAQRRGTTALIADLRKQGGTPEEVFAHPPLLRMTLDLLGADYRVCESFRYRLRPRLPLPIHVFAGREDELRESQLKAWQSEGAGRFSLDWFDSGHFFLKRQEEALLTRLVQRLTEDHNEVADAAKALV